MQKFIPSRPASQSDDIHQAPGVITRLGHDKTHPERLALIRSDGTVSNWFARDDTRQHVAAVLAANGFTLHADDSVTRKGE